MKWEETIRGIGPGMGLAVVVAVGAALILPGLGSHGLSDPWEMRQAYSAQRMNEAAVVQVIEPLSLPEKTYPTSELLSQPLAPSFPSWDQPATPTEFP